MADPFLGEIKMFAGNYAPPHWATCDGQIMPTNQNQALASLLGAIYGGDGQTTFGLPEMRGRVPMHFGTGPGLTSRAIGQRFGTETVTLTEDQMPTHTHSLQASTSQATSDSPAGTVLATPASSFYSDGNPPDKITALLGNNLGQSGGGMPHSNLMPYQTLTFIISLAGTYPSRN